MGTQCLTSICPGFNQSSGTPNCNGLGICNATTDTHFCGCNSGWSGALCNIAVCPGQNCSGNGTCVTTSTPPTCSCNYGWAGSDCATALPSQNVIPSDSQSQASTPEITFIMIYTASAVVGATLLAFVAVEIYRRRQRYMELRAFKRASQIFISREPSYADTKAVSASLGISV